MREPDEIRDMTEEERSVFGTCPICRAFPGDKCVPMQIMSVGFMIRGVEPEGGTHPARLKDAPNRKKMWRGGLRL